MVYLVSYDLNKPKQDYQSLYEKLKSLDSWWHYLDSTWLVDTSKNAKQIYDHILPAFDVNDRVLIIKVTRDYYGLLDQKAWDWINQRL